MPNVILVDDEIWALRDLENLLAPYPNYRILESFTNSKKALDAILSMHPDVVFTDLRMADLDGRDLINRIHERSPQTAIVIISAHSDFTVAREALGRNVIDYLLKPLSANGMAELIERNDVTHDVVIVFSLYASSEQELKVLIGQVMSRDDLKHCPHGRPICITLSKKQLEKQFKRA